jgi:hypothetical protein
MKKLDRWRFNVQSLAARKLYKRIAGQGDLQMTRMLKLFLFAVMALAIFGSTRLAEAQHAKSSGQTVYSVSNDDVPLGYNGHANSGSVFVNGVYTTKIRTGSYGIGGGYLGIHSVDIDIVDSSNECLFLSDAGGVSGAGPGDIFAYDAATHSGSRTLSAFGYNGNLYGIGLQHSGNVLVAAWGGSGELETFTIGTGCSLTPSNSSASGFGLGGGTVDGLAIAPNGTFAVATYEDGSYGFYPLNGASISAPAQYFSNCSNSLFFGVPVGIAISPDSSFVYLDCLYGENGALIDAFAAADPSVTVTNGPVTASGGVPINGSVTMGLSPDGTILYIVGTFSGSLESANVSGTSVTANSCTNLLLPGYNSQWIYPGTISVLGEGAGEGLVIPETAFGNTPDSYVQLVKIEANQCLEAVAQGTDANSLHALSGASYLKP